MKESIIILTGGGPAPGINTVIGSIAKAFLARGYRVLGLHGGYKGLFTPDPSYTEIGFCDGRLYLQQRRLAPYDESIQAHRKGL